MSRLGLSSVVPTLASEAPQGSGFTAVAPLNLSVAHSLTFQKSRHVCSREELMYGLLIPSKYCVGMGVRSTWHIANCRR